MGNHYWCIEPFDIDDGQLDGLSQQDAFVAGYELAQVHAAVASGHAFEGLVHACNSGRIARHLLRLKRRFTVTPTSDPNWRELRIQESDGGKGG